MKRILISGYYGFNNSGDEAILRVIIDNLRARLKEVEITVLSHDPEDTIRRYQVRAVNRMSPAAIFWAVSRCDLLLSGGGSLLQDATSQRSLAYYLTIIRLAQLFRKKVFIYSQGIGPIHRERNRIRTANCLKKVDSIVVRDSKSKELLTEIGVNPRDIHVTSDPVIRARRPDLSPGASILKNEDCPRHSGKLLVGWSLRQGAGEDAFTAETEKAIRWLQEERNADVVLLPFHYQQDIAVARRVKRDLKDTVGLVENRYLSEDMLSIVGNLDVMVGVRLHALIYSAVMNVPMIGISYDPKIDSFLNQVGMDSSLSVQNFTLERFQAMFDAVMGDYSGMQLRIAKNVEEMKRALSLNEEIICRLLGESEKGGRPC